MNFLLAVDPHKSLKPVEALSFGGQTLLLGMATVFSVLIIIWLSIILLKVLLHDIPEKKKKESQNTPVAPVVQPTVQETGDDEIVAVIAAAIAQAETENSGMKFRVVSFRRK